MPSKERPLRIGEDEAFSLLTEKAYLRGLREGLREGAPSRGSRWENLVSEKYFAKLEAGEWKDNYAPDIRFAG